MPNFGSIFQWKAQWNPNVPKGMQLEAFKIHPSNSVICKKTWQRSSISPVDLSLYFNYSLKHLKQRKVKMVFYCSCALLSTVNSNLFLCQKCRQCQRGESLAILNVQICSHAECQLKHLLKCCAFFKEKHQKTSFINTHPIFANCTNVQYLLERKVIKMK